MKALHTSLAAAVIAMAVLVGASPLLAGNFGPSAEALKAADRLLDAQNPKVMMADIVAKMSASLPPAVRDHFVQEMTSDEFLVRFRTNTRSVMAKHFSVEELDALTEFYSKPIAQSAMKKMGPYMADLMPFIQSEMMRLSRRLKEKSRQAP